MKQKNKKANRLVSLILTIVMVLTIVPTNIFALQQKNTNSMEITEKHLNANKYETYYYTDGIDYTYNGHNVEFISESEISVNGENINLKNKKIDVNIEVNDNRAMISFDKLDIPIYQVSGQWNSSYGGDYHINYNSDIPEKSIIKSESKNINQLVIDNLEAGEYHLTGGTIYEEANEWSPGIPEIGKNGNFGTLPDITISVGEGNTDGGDTGNSHKPDYGPIVTEVPDDFENDLWLQYNFREMKIGDTAKVYPRRIPQIISSSIANDVHRPNFNFEIISGDSITLDTTKSTQKSIATAVKEGNTIVKVTYDSTEYKDREYGASSQVNTAYVVFSVSNEESDIKISTNIKERSYDTIYFTDKSGIDFDFKVDTVNAEKIKVTCNGDVLESNDNNYTARLQNKSNVIGIEATDADGNVKSYYKVVDARLIEINIENKTTPGDIIYAGDTVRVSFKGISNPVAKLATIYNPTWPSSSSKGTFVEYNNDAVGKVKGYCSQWDLATKNSFEVTLSEAGTYTFDNGRIFSEWWGSTLGADKDTEGDDPNLNAPKNEDYFSSMPSFRINVADGNKPVVPVTGVTLDKQSVTLTEEESTNLIANVLPAHATNKNVVWSTSDNNIVTVENGKITGLKAGEAVIKATTEDGKFESSCTVTVKDKQFTQLENLIKEVEKLKPSDFMEEGWTVLTEKLEIAKAVLNNQESTTKDYKEAKDALQIAKDNLQTSQWKVVIEPEKIYPGDEVTVKLPNMPLPSLGRIIDLYTVYEFDMPNFVQDFEQKGEGTVESADASSNTKLIREIKFTVGGDVEPGTYTMSNGYVYARYFGHNGPLPPTSIYKGEMPNIEIIVADNNEAPLITASDVELYIGDSFDAKKNVTANDKEDGDITHKIEVVENTVNTSKSGVYKVIYKVSDSKNVETTLEIKVTVKERNTVPQRKSVKVGVYTDEKGIYESVDVELRENDTAYDVLKRALGNKVDAVETSLGIYVRGIDGLYEFDKGQGSGWVYAVNGTMPNVGAAVYKLNSGDEMVWHYTLNYGSDIQNSLDKFDKFINSNTGTNPNPNPNPDQGGVNLSDIKGHWAKKEIEEFISKGYINGYKDNTFKPNNDITRAEFIKIVNKVLGYTKVGKENFSDVDKTGWYYNDICRAVEAGYISGFEDNTFRPNEKITREQVAIILTNIHNNKDSNHDKLSKYKDGKDASDWAKSSLEGAIEAGYLNGYENNTIKPKNNMTRAEAVVTLSRMK